MESLFEKLRENRESGIYPYHMPGHKRRGAGDLRPEICGDDITEIEGFDNLHDPVDILKRLQNEASELYGAEESFYLINGSTAGVLSAVSAALPVGGRILMARNCHKSVYHGVYLRGLRAAYLYPPFMEDYDIVDAVTPKQVSDALEKEPDIGAVILVSPTYEGRIADIRRIVRIVHEKDIPLIVDEAHGAHLGLTRESCENSCQAGADIVIHSVHKTLPALTQSALLHVSGPRIDRNRLRRFLRIYQTSSPSYLLMASIDSALRFMRQEGVSAMNVFARRYERMLEDLKACRVLKFLPYDRERQDLGKLVISVREAGISGKELYDRLLCRYRLQTEMAGESYVLAMFTVCDGAEAYDRMTRALLEIDRELGALSGKERRPARIAEESEFLRSGWEYGVAQKSMDPAEHTAVIPLSEAWDMEMEERELSDSAGRICGEFVSLYPPGIPVLVPGERITAENCGRIAGLLKQGLMVQGVENGRIRVIVT